jgi:hypothetical protein
MPTYYFMIITTKSWTGGAVWRELNGKRVCVDSDPILSWMLESTYATAKAEITKRKWHIEEIREREFNQKLRNKS